MTDQKASQGDACQISRPVSWPEGPRNPQASYYRARYYDSTTGRFTSEDPTYILGGINAYAYVENDPADFVDPFGLQKCNCQVPPHPIGVDPNKNIQDAEENGYPWWFDHVKKWNGPWDYKNYNGQPHPEYDDFGNFNYGATGAAMGIPLNLLLRGAGFAKWRRYPGNDPFGRPWDKSGNFGNQPDKNQQIINGYNWFKNCGPHPQATPPLKLPPGWPASL